MEVATVSDFDRLMGDSLKAIRDDQLNEIEAEIPAARRQIASKVRTRRFTFVIGGVAVAAAVVAVALFIAQSVPDIDRADPIPPSGPPAIVARIDVPGAGAMAPGLGSLWVAHSDGLAGIDPATSEITTESPVDGVEHMALNSEAMYTVNTFDRTIGRLPFGTDEAATTTRVEGNPTLVAASDESVWFAVDAGPGNDTEILRTDPELGREESIRPLTAGPPTSENRVVADMTYAEGALWLSATQSGTDSVIGYEVRRYVDDTDTTWELTESEGSVADIAVGEGAVWILRQSTEGSGNTISRIDLATNEITERAVEFEDTLESVAVGEGYLWATTAPTGMDMPDDARASLHRIDPTTLEPAGEPIEVAGPGSKLAVGYGFVWVGDPNNKQIVQIDPSTESSPDPEPSATPAPENTEDATPIEEQCRTFLPFLSTDGALELSLGSGGQTDVPLAQQSPQALVHYAEGDERYIDVIAGQTVSTPVDEERIEVLGTNGWLHQTENGYAVTFGMGGCEFQLLTYGFQEDGVRDFVSSLALRGHSGSFDDSFVMWPEASPEGMYKECAPAFGQAFLAKAEDAALRFARDELRWTEAVIAEPTAGYDMERGYQAVEVARDPTSSGSPRVLIILREIAIDCWAVVFVQTVDVTAPGRAVSEEGIDVSSVGGRTKVNFDLEREAAGREVGSIRLTVGPGSVLLYPQEFRDNGGIELTDAPRNAPTYLLVRLFDPDGDVIGAIGRPLPSAQIGNQED